jgi:hypothetical protein
MIAATVLRTFDTTISFLLLVEGPSWAHGPLYGCLIFALNAPLLRFLPRNVGDVLLEFLL